MFEAKDTPLRNDVNMLGTILGDVLKEQGGDALFEQVETVRRLARRRREGDHQAASALSQLLAPLSLPDMMALSRAFSAYFGGVNLAERVHRIRRRRDIPGPAGQAPAWHTHRCASGPAWPRRGLLSKCRRSLKISR